MKKIPLFSTSILVCIVAFSACNPVAATPDVALQPTLPPPVPTKTLTLQPEPTKKQVFIPNVSYVSNGTKDQKLDVFLPEIEGPFPTILAFHGGAFQSGPGYPSKSMYRKYAYYFNDLGYAFVSADYRLAPTYTYPAQVEDVFCALAWVHANHQIYGLDPGHIIIMGDSAGGYLAAMLSTIETPELYLEDCPNKLPASDWIQGTVVFYGFFDITDVSDHPGKGSLLEPYLGTAWDEVPLERLEEMSPMSWVGGSEAPFLLIHGTLDTTLPSSMSTNFAEALDDVGVQVEVLLVEDDHRFLLKPLTNPANSQSLKAIEAFLRTVIGR